MAAVVWGEVAYQVIGNDQLVDAHWGNEDSEVWEAGQAAVCIEVLNLTAQWAQSRADDAALEAVRARDL